MSSRQQRLGRNTHWLCLLGMLVHALPGLAAEPYRAEAVKAAFLYRFTGFVEWPDQVLQSRPQFTIAVLDGKSVAKELSRLLAQRAIKNMPARVVTVVSPLQAGDAQMVYVGPGFTGDLREVIDALAGKPVLIVTDHPRGLDVGGAVNFMLVDRRVRFEVSLPAAQNAGIKVSSELLSVAARVRGTRLRMDIACTRPVPQSDVDVFCNQRLAFL
jgi:hypothetical protein